MVFNKEFKEALKHLPEAKKDKLILRLLKKDLILANQLLFELVNTNTVDDQRALAKKSILSQARRTKENFYSIGYLNMDVRLLSGEITQHVKITKDKFGEAHLNLVMINEILYQNKAHILGEKFNDKTRKFCTAVVSRVFKILILISRLDDDYFIEFEADLQTLGQYISENKYVMNIAIKNGLDINWLLLPDIPKDIFQIHKNIREMGFLK